MLVSFVSGLTFYASKLCLSSVKMLCVCKFKYLPGNNGFWFEKKLTLITWSAAVCASLWVKTKRSADRPDVDQRQSILKIAHKCYFGEARFVFREASQPRFVILTRRFKESQSGNFALGAVKITVSGVSREVLSGGWMLFNINFCWWELLGTVEGGNAGKWSHFR